MKTLKRIYQEYKPLLKGCLHAFLIISIYDWVIAPGLTAANTFVNILSILLGILMMVLVGILIWENLFKTEKNQQKCNETISETDGQTSYTDNENSKNKKEEKTKN